MRPDSRRADGDVAERTAETFEDRCPDEERHVGSRDTIEELRAQVVAHEAVITGERLRDVDVASCRRSSRAPRGTDRPAILRFARRDRSRLVPRASMPAASSSNCASASIHGEVFRSELEDDALRAQPRNGHRHLLAGADRKIVSRLAGGVRGRRSCRGTQAFVITSALSRTSATGSCIAAIEATRRMTSATPVPGEARAAEHHRLERLDAIQRSREVGEEHGGVVVAIVRREPCDARLLVFGPLGEQGRLPVARRRDDREHGTTRRCDEPLDDRGPADDAGAKLRRVQLGLVERKTGHWPTPKISSVADR